MKKILTNKLFSDSLIYFLSQIINKILPFLLIPLITRYLSPDEYGVVVSFTALMAFCAVFVGLSTNGAVNVTYFKVAHEKMKTYVYAALVALLVSALVMSFVIHIFSDIIFNRLGITELWSQLAVLTALFQFITLINLSLWQAEQKAKYFGLYQIFQSLLITCMTVVFIFYLHLRESGVIFATVGSVAIFGLLSFVFLWRRDYITVSLKYTDIKDLLSFGIPMIPHQLSGWILTQYDKMFILSMLGLSAAGVYTIGFQFGMLISVLTLAFNKAWAPFLFKKLASKPSYTDKIKLVKYTYIYFVSILILACFITFLSPYIIPWYVGKQYIGSVQFVSIIAFAFAFNGMYFMVVNYLFYMKRTQILALITFGNSVIYMISSYVLLKIFGSIGVAYATLISYLLSFILVWRASHSIYPMPWKFWKNHE